MQTIIESGPTFQKIDTGAVSDGIMEQVRSLLRAGKLAPGDRLPAERELAEQLGVSRISLREALRALTAMGILETRPGSGTRVAMNGEGLMSLPFEFMMLFDKPGITDLFAARELIEIYMAERAAENRSLEDLASIEAALEALKDCESELDNGAAANRRFHKAVAAAAHNPVLERMLGCILDQRSAYIESLAPDRGDWVGCEEAHERLVSAIQRQDVAEARRAMTLDMAIAGDFWRYVQAKAENLR
jgi:GntR family transcriptional repressor for pyruvate dehydrogenase complex